MRRLSSLAVAALLLGGAPRADAQTEAPDAAVPDAGPPEAPVVAPSPPVVVPPPPPVVVAPPPPVRRSPPPAGAEPIAPRVRRGLVVMPFVGMHSLQNEADSFADPGLRVGAFLGRFINNDVSLNGAVTFDLVNPNDNLTADLHREMLELTFSPLLHMGSPQVEFIVGPKVGLWNLWTRFSAPPPRALSSEGTGQGWTLGGNLGLLVAVPRVGLVGVLLNLELRDGLHACGSDSNGREACAWGGDSSTLLGVSLAVLL
jgi:hypothetical protein